MDGRSGGLLRKGGFKMKATKTVPDNDLVKKGIEILFLELGKVDAIRFLTMPREKRVEGVKRHREWQQTLNKDAFFDEIFADPEIFKVPQKGLS